MGKKSYAKSWFLSGNFAPVEVENDRMQVIVEGTIPDDLIGGCYVRNGPNPQFDRGDRLYHWFDGDGMLHSVHFTRNSRSSQQLAYYSNKYVRTEKFLLERENGKPIWPTMGELISSHTWPAFKANLTGAFMEIINPLGIRSNTTSNTALAYHSRKLLSLNEGGPPYHVIAPEMSTNGIEDFEGKLKHNFTAHPKIDPVTGEMVFIGYKPPTTQISHSVVSKDGKLLSTIQIPLPRCVMMHDFAITKNYSIIFDLPLVLQTEKILDASKLLFFDTKIPARFGILPRHAKDAKEVKWFEAKNCMIFHSSNAYEDGDEVVLISCRATKIFIGHPEDAEEDYELVNKSFVYEHRFNLKTGAVQERQIGQDLVDFPVIRNDLVGQKFRYTYAARFPFRYDLKRETDAIVKYDLATNESSTFVYGEGKYGGEAVFVPKKGGETEDSGYLLSYIFDEATQESELWIIDAKTMQHPPIARVKVGIRIPYGFHGLWVDEENLKNQNKQKTVLKPLTNWYKIVTNSVKVAAFALLIWGVWKKARARN